MKPELLTEGEEIFLDTDDEEPTVLTKELSNKLNREEREEFERNCDKNPFQTIVPLNFIGSYLTISSYKDTDKYLCDITNLLENIRIALNETCLLVLGVNKTIWLYQDNDYLTVKNALTYLKSKIDKDFNGGFMLKESELLEFIPHLFWLIRCNASLPYFYFSYPNSKTVITICRFGVLHFDFYEQREKQQILDILSSMKFQEVDSCDDYIEFDNFDGRKIKL